MTEYRVCSIEGCGKKRKGKLYCECHARKIRIYGDPNGGRVSPGALAKWLEEVAQRYQGDDCLPWPFWRNNNGYGLLGHSGKSEGAHRYLLRLISGKDGVGMEACHSCGKGHEGCVNPRHLNWGTSADNKADRIAHGTANRGERHGRTKLTNDQALKIRAMADQPGKSIKSVADHFGITYNVAYCIKKRTSFKYL